MRTIDKSTQFKKDYKKALRSIDRLELDRRFSFVFSCLLADQPIPERFKDHTLKAY
jgi:mRNA interferase YafQ